MTQELMTVKDAVKVLNDGLQAVVDALGILNRRLVAVEDQVRELQLAQAPKEP